MTQTLNSPLEVGIRAVVMLTELYPTTADISRLVLLDHVVLHSADFGGQSSLHPSPRTRSGELGLKRALIVQGIAIMALAGLISEVASINGIAYQASDDALPFLDTLESDYLDRLAERSVWASTNYGMLQDSAIRSELRQVFGQWSEEFELANIHDGELE
jgi:hypothetical protein